MTALASLSIPNFNYCNFVRSAIRSLLPQTYRQEFNLDGGIANSLSLLELFSLLEELLGVSLRYEQTLPQSSDQRVSVADNVKAARLLRWKPQVPVRKGIPSTLDSLREETGAV